MKSLVVDPSILWGDLLVSALRSQRMDVSHVCKSVQEIKPSDIGAGCDIVLFRRDSPKMSYSSLSKMMREHAENAKVLVLGPPIAQREAFDVVSSGLGGYFCHDRPIGTLINAMKFVRAGGIYIPESVLSAGETHSSGIFSPRELQVIAAVAVGFSNKQVAEKLGLAEATIKLHVKTVMRKLSARNRAHVAGLAFYSDIVPRSLFDEMVRSL